MAELVFYTGPMDCGKSTLALQVDYTQSTHDRIGRLFTCLDRNGTAVITSRIGLSQAAIEVTPDLDFWRYIVTELTEFKRIDYLVCDEAQFYSTDQIEQLARVVDELQIDVFAFGILSDFRTRLFPGSRRLVELADRMESLQVSQLCWCGQNGTHNARIIDGEMVIEGNQVVVGDTAKSDSVVRYEVLCRAHHRKKMPKEQAMAILNPDPLPLDDTAVNRII
ncbi:MAG: thymidine kinase [Propionibacterium sp.]|nr:MAG: thymidine kinase [Propionibacterium sp.]